MHILSIAPQQPASATCARARQKITPPKKTIQGNTALVPQEGKVAASACGKVPQRKKCRKYLAVQITGLWAVHSRRNSKTTDKSDEPSGGGESKSEAEDSEEEESNNSSKNSEPSEHTCLNQVKEEGVASRIRQLTLQDRVLVNTTPPEQQTEPMASNLAGPSGWMWTKTNSITLKAAHPDPFYGEILKAKIFLQQVNNKIANAAGVSERQQIRYKISLLKKPAAEWAATYMDDEGYTTFKKYGDLRRKFLKRFTDPNLSGTALAQLLRLNKDVLGSRSMPHKH